MKKAELVFIPAPAIGHIYSIIEFAKLLLERDDRFSITVLIMESAREQSIQLASHHSKIRFIDLPHVEPPPLDILRTSLEKYVSLLIESHRACVKEAIINHVLPNSSSLLGLVLDLFCISMVDVGKELGVPSYLFFTGSAAFLGFVVYLPTWHDQMGREFEESDTELTIPGFINPVPASALPTSAFNKEGGFISMVNQAKRVKETKGIFANTFQELEFHAVNSLSSAYDLPPVYTVGPIINHEKQIHAQSSSQDQHDKIMKWLDDQPPSSVVFLCFGSWGSFEEPQLKEIALGLEQSEHRFLWSIRVASKEDNLSMPSENIDHKAILPEGFLERTKDKGLVCGWAPQVDVLAQKAVGGFVSHCGWNSILESLWYGVPIAAWPLYAEQQFNAFDIVKNLELAVELKLDYRTASDSIVKAEEIAMAVKCVMRAESQLRDKVRDMSLQSRKTLMTGGSSFDSVGHLIETLLATN